MHSRTISKLSTAGGAMASVCAGPVRNELAAALAFAARSLQTGMATKVRAAAAPRAEARIRANMCRERPRAVLAAATQLRPPLARRDVIVREVNDGAIPADRAEAIKDALPRLRWPRSRCTTTASRGDGSTRHGPISATVRNRRDISTRSIQPTGSAKAADQCRKFLLR